MSAARSCSPGGYWIVVSSIAFRANMYAAQYAEDQCVHGKAYLGLQLTSMYDPGSIQLPWDNPRPRTRSGYHKDVQLLRYGAAATGGALLLGWLKRRLCKVPVIGLVAAPVLLFVPTALIGAAVGAAALYGYDEGDIMAVRKKLVPKVRKHMRRVRREVSSIAEDIGADLRQLSRDNERALWRLQQEGEAAARRLAPVVEDTARTLETSAAQLERSAHRGRAALDRQLQAPRGGSE